MFNFPLLQKYMFATGSRAGIGNYKTGFCTGEPVIIVRLLQCQSLQSAEHGNWQVTGSGTGISAITVRVPVL